MKAKGQKTLLGRFMVLLGATMILAAVGCVALIFLGMGDTAGSVPPEGGPVQTQDTHGPADKTLYLTVPKIGIEDLKVYDSLSEEKLGDSAIHVPGTGFPWQSGTNTYIAGHRTGFVGTDSFLVFFRLNELESGDEIILKDSNGAGYVYQVRGGTVVTPEDVEVMNPVAGKSIVSLQTCTLPDFSNRLVVQGELVA